MFYRDDLEAAKSEKKVEEAHEANMIRVSEPYDDTPEWWLENDGIAHLGDEWLEFYLNAILTEFPKMLNHAIRYAFGSPYVNIRYPNYKIWFQECWKDLAGKEGAGDEMTLFDWDAAYEQYNND
jgi:hypothetical protein